MFHTGFTVNRSLNASGKKNLHGWRIFLNKLFDKIEPGGHAGAFGIYDAVQFIFGLQIKPELRRSPKEAAQPHGCVRGDRSLPVDDLVDPARGNA